MGEKKHQGRFTVQFNLGDPQQARVSEILERQGRQKARFISTAILHYINCKETPEVALPLAPNTEEIEKLVLAILNKHTGENNTYHLQQEAVITGESACASDVTPEREEPTDDLKALLGDGGFSAIANTLMSFRQK